MTLSEEMTESLGLMSVSNSKSTEKVDLKCQNAKNSKLYIMKVRDVVCQQIAVLACLDSLPALQDAGT